MNDFVPLAIFVTVRYPVLAIKSLARTQREHILRLTLDDVSFIHGGK
jgi:hypothetical protein